MESSDTNEEIIDWNHAVYMLGKLMDVINILVCGEGDAKNRLLVASTSLLKVKPHMLPETAEIRHRVEMAYSMLTKYYHPSDISTITFPETIFSKTIRRIRNKTASKIIGYLFGAWMDLSDLVDEHRNMSNS